MEKEKNAEQKTAAKNLSETRPQTSKCTRRLACICVCLSQIRFAEVYYRIS